MTMTMLRTFASPVTLGAGAGAPELPPHATKNKLAAASKAILVSCENMTVSADHFSSSQAEVASSTFIVRCTTSGLGRRFLHRENQVSPGVKNELLWTERSENILRPNVVHGRGTVTPLPPDPEHRALN
jgi:hypothetical protein